MKNIINRIKNDKVLFFLSILIIGVFLVLVIRITYSYLAAFINEARENVTLGSDTTDEFKFIEGEAIDLNVTPTTLPEGGGNYAKSTTYGASLLANSTNNTAEESYYVYFNVTANTLGYIQEGNPEVILTVFQGETEITNIDGLTYGTYNGVTGFDVTTATGMFTVASDYAITSNSSTDATVQNWTFTLTYLNQNYDQSGNYGNNMNVEFIMSKEEKTPSLADLCNGLTLSECITTQVYTGTDGENGLYYHDGVGTYINADQEAGDNSYRYAGANPDNYVCFGDDCSNEDNLYRIIGVFGNQVKLIKNDYATIDMVGTNGNDYYGTYDLIPMNSTEYYKGNIGINEIPTFYWNNIDELQLNLWEESDLNNVNLNINYISYLGSNWSEKIDEVSWVTGGNIYQNITEISVKNAFHNEIESPAEDRTHDAKIGLMYVSDYGFAVSPEYWITSLGDYDTAISNNWMYMGLNEWTITRLSDVSFYAFLVYNSGFVTTNLSSYLAVRPCFYLTSSTTYVSGTGTQSDPYRIV